MKLSFKQKTHSFVHSYSFIRNMTNVYRIRGGNLHHEDIECKIIPDAPLVGRTVKTALKDKEAKWCAECSHDKYPIESVITLRSGEHKTILITEEDKKFRDDFDKDPHSAICRAFRKKLIDYNKSETKTDLIIQVPRTIQEWRISTNMLGVICKGMEKIAFICGQCFSANGFGEITFPVNAGGVNSVALFADYLDKNPSEGALVVSEENLPGEKKQDDEPISEMKIESGDKNERDDHNKDEHPSLADQLIGHPETKDCKLDECGVCGKRDCPHGDETHYWHDGCVSCSHTTASRQE